MRNAQKAFSTHLLACRQRPIPKTPQDEPSPTTAPKTDTTTRAHPQDAVCRCAAGRCRLRSTPPGPSSGPAGEWVGGVLRRRPGKRGGEQPLAPMRKTHTRGWSSHMRKPHQPPCPTPAGSSPGPVPAPHAGDRGHDRRSQAPRTSGRRRTPTPRKAAPTRQRLTPHAVPTERRIPPPTQPALRENRDRNTLPHSSQHTPPPGKTA